MREILKARHAELVAERERNGEQMIAVRSALAKLERTDYGYGIALGEIERLLAQCEPVPNEETPHDLA